MTCPLTDLLGRAEWPDPVLGTDAAGGWPAGELDRLARLGLLVDAGPAGAFACDACGRDHVEEVQWVRVPGLEPRAFVACPEYGFVRVDPGRLRRWAVRLPVLADAVARAVRPGGGAVERIPGRVWRLGPVRAGGRVWAGLLAVGLARPDGAAVVAGVPELRAANAAVFIPAITPPAAIWPTDRHPAVVPLTDFLSPGADGLVADRAALDSALATSVRSLPKAAANPFPTPPGTDWEGVELVVGDHRVTVRAGGVVRTFGFAEAGFEDRRKGNVPDDGWVVLTALARLGGVLGTGDRLTTKPGDLKQKVSALRKRLRALVGIEADPFHPTGRGKAYRARFAIRAATGATFPTPAGATWDDITVTEVIPGVVEVAVAAPTTDVTFVRGDDEDGGAWEGTTATGEHRRRYALAELGLAGPGGDPSPAGEALGALLRAGGRLARPATDPGMLALGKALGAFFRLPDPPFEFDPARRRWAARFEAASVVPRPHR